MGYSRDIWGHNNYVGIFENTRIRWWTSIYKRTVILYLVSSLINLAVLTWCQELGLSMSKSKPPKLDLGSCEDKKEAVELWLDQF